MNSLDKLLNNGSVQTVVEDSIYHAAVREVKRLRNIEKLWNAAQQGVQADGAYCRCGDVGYGDKLNRCVTCGQFKSPRR